MHITESGHMSVKLSGDYISATEGKQRVKFKDRLVISYSKINPFMPNVP